MWTNSGGVGGYGTAARGGRGAATGKPATGEANKIGDLNTPTRLILRKVTDNTGDGVGDGDGGMEEGRRNKRGLDECTHLDGYVDHAEESKRHENG
jgi:hypothetical protein